MQPAELAAFHPGPGLPHHWVVAVNEGHREERPRAARRGEKLTRTLEVGRDWFLADNVLSGFERCHPERNVHLIRRADVYHVDVRVRHKGKRILECFPGAEPLCRVLRACEG